MATSTTITASSNDHQVSSDDTVIVMNHEDRVVLKSAARYLKRNVRAKASWRVTLLKSYGGEEASQAFDPGRTARAGFRLLV